MSTFHISHILPQRPHLTPSCHFENVLANDDQGFAVSTSPEAVEGAPRPVLLTSKSFQVGAVDMGVARSVSETMIYF
jgi:hypothetical protein